MSWSGSYTIPAGGSQEAVNKAVGEMQIHGNNDCPEERAAAVTAALGAATELIGSGVLGDPAAHGWHVQINGHCNPGNAKEPGSGADCIGVNIRQT